MKEAPRQAEPDFLGRLVDKALGRSDAVVPRLPSVFEPLQPLAVPLYPEWGMLAQSHEEVEAGSSRTVTVGGKPETLRFDPLRADGQRGAAQAEGKAGRHVSAALMASHVSLASAGAAPSVAQPREEVEADARSRRKIAPPVTSEPKADSSRVVTVGGKPETPRFDPLRADAQRDTAQADAEPVRPSSAALVVSPHPLTSVGETQASTQLLTFA